MKKTLKFLLYSFILFLVVSLQVSAVSMPKLVMINPGEDSSTEMNINYWTADEGTYVSFYPEGASPSSANLVFPECVATPFTGRTEKQCKATMTNLVPDTVYYYKVEASSMEDVRSFKTAGAEEFTFSHVTDVHSWFSGGTNNRVARATAVMNKINDIKELDFVLSSGDMTAYGTVYEQWEALFNMNVLQNKMYASTPGNHDYYNTAAVTQNSSYFNATHNNPNNGAVGVKNTTYYFKYGNTLFISLNSEDAADISLARAAQIAWLNEVTAKNPADFIIVYTHRPFYTGDGLNAGQARDMRNWFQEIFDNTGVDLVLAGHNHAYARTYQVYKDAIIEGPSKGTVYNTGMQIGDRHKTEAGTKMPQVEHAHINEDGANLITVTKDKISIEFVKTNGDRLYQMDILNKSSFIVKHDLEKSIKGTKQGENALVEFDFPAPGLIKEINVSDNDGLITNRLNPTSGVVTLANAPQIGRYKLDVEMILRDSQVINKEVIVIDERYDFGEVTNFVFEEEERYVTLSWESDLKNNMVKAYEIWVNGVALKRIDITNSTTILDKVSPYEKNKLLFKLLDKDFKVLEEYQLDYGVKTPQTFVFFETQELELKKGDTHQLKFDTYPEGAQVDIEFHSSDESICTVDANGKITTVGEGSCTITVNVIKRWDSSDTVNITVKSAPVLTPDPVDPPKKGCRSSAYIFTGLSVLGLAFFLRRRKY